MGADREGQAGEERKRMRHEISGREERNREGKMNLKPVLFMQVVSFDRLYVDVVAL